MMQTISNDTIASKLHGLVELAEQKPVSHDGLGGGRSALALMYFFYGDCFNLPAASEKGLALVEQVFANLENKNGESLSTYDFFSGLAGMLSTLVTLKNNNLLDIDFNDLEQMDRLAYDWAMEELEKSNIDFFYGATGVLSYLKERTDLPVDAPHIDGLVHKMLSLFDKDEFVIINRFYNRADNRYVHEVNFSMAHGMVSVLQCLLDIHQKGFNKYGIGQAICSGIEYIIRAGNMQTVPAPHAFANALNVESKTALYQKRLGWCFSDLNILHLLYRGAEVTGNHSWKQLADSKAAQVAERISMNDTLVDDPFICHGSVGMVQYYNTLYELSNNPVFLKAKDFWLHDALQRLDGLPAAYFDSREYTARAHIHSLFYGLTGVCLGLLSAFDPKYSSWSKLIML